jgi:hypothetical protein
VLPHPKLDKKLFRNLKKIIRMLGGGGLDVFMNMHMIFIKLEAHLVKKIVLPIVTYVN